MNRTSEGCAVWWIDYGGSKYRYRNDYNWDFLKLLPLDCSNYVAWHIPTEGMALVDLWFDTRSPEDGPISGVLADWLDDHREQLLEEAVGPDPAGRLDLLIRWLREVRCWGKESVSV